MHFRAYFELKRDLNNTYLYLPFIKISKKKNLFSGFILRSDVVLYTTTLLPATVRIFMLFPTTIHGTYVQTDK